MFLLMILLVFSIDGIDFLFLRGMMTAKNCISFTLVMSVGCWMMVLCLFDHADFWEIRNENAYQSRSLTEPSIESEWRYMRHTFQQSAIHQQLLLPNGRPQSLRCRFIATSSWWRLLSGGRQKRVFVQEKTC